MALLRKQAKSVINISAQLAENTLTMACGSTPIVSRAHAKSITFLLRESHDIETHCFVERSLKLIASREP